MPSSRPRVPKTTIAALAVIVAASAATAGMLRAVQNSAPSAITIVDPAAAGGGFSPVAAGPGAESAGTTEDSGSGPWAQPSSVRRTGNTPGQPPAGQGRPVSTPRSSGGTGSTGGPGAAPSTGPAVGSLIWDGRPSGNRSEFAALDCAKPGSLTIENDLRFGPIWVFDKPAGDNQCGAHGIAPSRAKYDFKDDATYYIGWWSKVSSTADDNADFQWMSYGTGTTQGFPFVISAHGGHATVVQRQPGSNGQTVWTSPATLAPNTWHHYIVGIHTSDALTGGWIELWYDGKPQTFANGTSQYACRTWDVNDDPRWGENGAQGSAVTNYLYAPKVGTSYTSVAS